jgi:hypothetical protein
MSSFNARLRMPGLSKLPLGVDVDIFRERITVIAGDRKVGDWALEELDIESRSDGFHISVDGEKIILNVTDSIRFAAELGIAGPRRVRLVEIPSAAPPRGGLSSIKGQLNYQRAVNGGPSSSLTAAETSPDGGQVDEIRRRIAEVAQALASDSVSPAQAFARWLNLLKEVNHRHGQGSMSTDRFFELNTELLDLIPGLTPDFI